jgi:hypothetical protein
MTHPLAYRVAARTLVADQDKAAPKKIDDLVKEVKDGNPSYSDEQAYATAWSIYCKNVDPGSSHCHKPASQYLKEAVAEEAAKVVPNNYVDKHQLRILIDTVKNPMKGKFLGGPSAEEAEETLKSKFKWTDADIHKLKQAAEGSITRPTPSAQEQVAGDGQALYRSIRPGDRVTIVNRHGQESSGRAVMRGPSGWVLNMGGKHGTPAIASPENITDVKHGKGGGGAYGIG